MEIESQAILQQIRSEEDPVKKAKLIEVLHENGIRTKEIAEGLGIQSSYVCHLVRLLRLPPLILDGYYSKSITLSHLFIISRLKDQDAMITAYETVMSKNLTAYQTEQIIREKLFSIETKGIRIPTEELYNFAFTFHEEVPEAEVSVIQTRVRGKITLEVKGNTEITSTILRGIMEKLRRGIGVKRKLPHFPVENLVEMDSPSSPFSEEENTDTKLDQ